MISFKENDKLADVIHKDHTLLPVINRLGVKLGFGNATIKQLCIREGINVNFFMEIINVFHDDNYFPEKKLLNFEVPLLVEYLIKTHQYYKEHVISEQERLLDLFLSREKDESQIDKMIRKFYRSYLEEFYNHLQFEEKTVFPYVIQLDETVRKSGDKSLMNSFKDFTIEIFEKTHSNLDEKMEDLQNIILKYLPPQFNNNVGNSLLSNLFLFEKDLKNHARIEDQILIPKVKELEKKMLQNE